MRVRKIAYAGIFIALILGIGYTLAFVPNVELVTALIFMAGALLGVKWGIFIGLLGEFLFSALNPMGSGLLFPPMLICQVLAMACVGGVGGLTRKKIKNQEIGTGNKLLIGCLGLLLTLFYDLAVSLAYPISAGFNFKAIVATLIAGLAFSAIHLVVNTLIFLIIVPVAIHRIYRAIPFFREV